LLQISDKAQQQIDIILRKQQQQQHQTKEVDFLGLGSKIDNNNDSNSNSNSNHGNFWKVPSKSLSPKQRRRHSVEHPCYVPRLRHVLNSEFWLSQYRWYIYYFQPRRMKYVYFILLIQQFYKFRMKKQTQIQLPPTFTFYFAGNQSIINKKHTSSFSKRSSKKNEKNESALTFDEICNLLTFDLKNMNPETQKELNLLQYSQFIYYHFVHNMASYKIQFSDKSIVKYIEESLFEDCNVAERQRTFKTLINIKIFDKMWNAVFRYLHQMTYEPFVIWMNTK